MNQAIAMKILLALAQYYTLTRRMLQQLCMPGYDDRSARKSLLGLLQSGLVNKATVEVCRPAMGIPAPVYYPSRKGCDYLVAALKDERFYDTCTLRPNWQHMYHWLRVADFHIMLDRAIALQQDVQVEKWISEWDRLKNPNGTGPESIYALFTLLREKPRLVCAPDAGILLSYRTAQKTYYRPWYLELDRSTSGIQQIAASKTPGYAAMAESSRKLWTRHFPNTGDTPFRVLLVTDTVGRRNAIQKVMSTKPGAALWRFGAWPELKPETVLFDKVFIDIEGNPVSLVKRLENAGPQ